MPKTAPHLDRLLPSRQHDVWAPRQITALEPEAVAHGVQKAADYDFGLRIAAADSSQVAASGVWDVREVRALLARGSVLGHVGAMSSRERRWAVVALFDGGKSAHSWMGRATDPTEEEIERAAASLRERGVPAWLAVTEGAYYSAEQMTAVPVRVLSGEGDWEAAWAAFLAARRTRLTEANDGLE